MHINHSHTHTHKSAEKKEKKKEKVNENVCEMLDAMARVGSHRNIERCNRTIQGFYVFIEKHYICAYKLGSTYTPNVKWNETNTEQWQHRCAHIHSFAHTFNIRLALSLSLSIRLYTLSVSRTHKLTIIFIRQYYYHHYYYYYYYFRDFLENKISTFIRSNWTMPIEWTDYPDTQRVIQRKI